MDYPRPKGSCQNGEVRSKSPVKLMCMGFAGP